MSLKTKAAEIESQRIQNAIASGLSSPRNGISKAKEKQCRDRAKNNVYERKLECFDALLAACRAAYAELTAKLDVNAPGVARDMCVQAIMRYDGKPPVPETVEPGV